RARRTGDDRQGAAASRDVTADGAPTGPRLQFGAMDEQEYLRAADACLERAARWLEDLEDLDVTAGDGLVTIEFDDGTRFVLNRQSAARQMWLAAGARAWHYGWDPGRRAWLDDRDGHELFARLAEVVSGQLGVELGPP